jgi:phosphopantothenoylcysteine decarboxylase/phosphopantothenate--cysteine ligase
VRVLVTGGPTHEPWDDVRYLANRSTGRMGVAIAEAARKAGHRVTLVLGPTATRAPRGVRTIRVTTAREMLAACVGVFPKHDAVFMTAAVADWRPAARVRGKPSKEGTSPLLRLAKNPDILARLGRMSRGQVIVGFALETGPEESALAKARRKLRRKRADLVVLNRPDSLGGATANGVTLITEWEAVSLGVIDKRKLADLLVQFAEGSRESGTGRGAGNRRRTGA